MPSEDELTNPTQVNTSGGAVVEGNINTSGGDFIGRDKIVIIEEAAYQVYGLTNPYLGLRAFRYEDSAIYAGREQLAQETVQRLTQPGAQQTLLFITGASGSGKSSFAQAGLIPLLENHYATYEKTVRHAIMRPSSQPMVMLADALQKLHPTLTLATLGTNAPEGQINLLLIDQFEELFIQSNASQRTPFCDFLTNLSSFAACRTHILVTLRIDYLDELFAIQPLWAIAKEGVELRTMSADDLRNAIQKPLQVHHPQNRFAPELLDRLVQDAGAAAALLPLLQVTLAELWKTGKLVLSNYGSLTNAIRQRADTVYEFSDYDKADPKIKRSTDEQQALMAILFDLISVSVDGGDRRDVRQRRTRHELEQDSAQRSRLIEELVNARLLTAASETRNGVDVEVIDIIHESLIDNWERLRSTIEEQRQQLQRRARFKLWLGEWVRSERKDGYLLLTDMQLAEARVLVTGQDIEVQAAKAQEFYQRSVKHQEETQRRQVRTFRTVAVVMAFLFLLAALAAGWGFQNLGSARQSEAAAIAARATSDANVVQKEQERERAEQQRAIARSGELRLESKSNLDNGNYELAILLAIEAGRSSDAIASFEAIRTAINNPTHSRAVFYEQTRKNPPTPAMIAFAQWSHNEAKVLTVGAGMTAHIWDAANGKSLAVLAGHTDQIMTAQWSRDDSKLLTASADHTARIWDVASGNQKLLFIGHTDQINFAQWSQDESKILTASDDGTAQIWEVASGRSLLPLNGHTGNVIAAQWNQDESKILTFGGDGTTRIWDATDGTQIAIWEQASDVKSAEWNRDGSQILTTTYDGVVYIYDVIGGNSTALPEDIGKITAAHWSDDNSKIQVTANIGNAGIWDLTTNSWSYKLSTNEIFQLDYSSPLPTIKEVGGNEQMTQLDVNSTEITFMQWIDGGANILTGDNRGVIRIWNAIDGKPVLIFKGHTAPILTMQISQDTAKILTSDAGGTTLIWDYQRGAESVTLETAGNYTTPFALWLQNDNSILSNGSLFDVKSGKKVATLAGFPDYVTSVQWSHDRRKILADSADGRVFIWDAEHGQQLAVYEGHKSHITSVQWSRDDSKILTGSTDGTAQIWDVSGHQQIVLAHAGEVTFTQWSHNEEKIFTASSDTTGRIWDVQTRDLLTTLKALPAYIQYVQWSKDDNKLLIQSSNSIQIWDVASGNELFKREQISAAQWSQDETKILTGSRDGAVYIWEINRSEPLMNFRGHTDSISSVQWSRDESRVLTGSNDGTARIWTAVSGRQSLEFNVNPMFIQKSDNIGDPVTFADWSNDETKVLLSTTGTATLWDVVNDKKLVEFLGITQPGVEARWNHAGTMILEVSDRNGIQRVWYSNIHDLIDAACNQWVARNMNWNEWQTHMDIPYRPTCIQKPIPPDVTESIKLESEALLEAGQTISATQRLEELNDWLQINGQFKSYGVDVTAFVAEVSATATAAVLPSPTITPTSTQ